MADSKQVFAICMLLATISCVLCARECIPVHGYESCACYFPAVNDTRRYVNLLPLKINSSSPRFTSKTENDWYISYSPCGEFSAFVGENSTGTTSCSKTSVARWTNLSAHQCDSLGDEASGKFEMDVHNEFIKSNLTLKFRDERSGHRAVISLICNYSLPQNETFFEYVNTSNIQVDTYYLSLTSECCCPGKCGIPPEIPYTLEIPTDNYTGFCSRELQLKSDATDVCEPHIVALSSRPGSSSKSTGGLEKWQIAVIVVGGVLLLLLIVSLVFFCGKKRRAYQTI